MRTADPDERPWLASASIAAVTATIAFAAYTRTLLPGVDLGDTGGFQAAILWPEWSARQGYPLYYALARPFVAALSPLNPARGLNLFTALTAAAAVGLLTYIAGLVSRSALAGAGAGLLLAFSYTFWSQAVIAEVYALHLALMAACLIALHAYAVRPSMRRLAVFFVVYALSFGHHLLMILLLVPFAVFLVTVHPAPRVLVRPRVMALALAAALAGLLLYASNFLFIWTNIDASPRWTERMAAFWFDTTKADWRGAMVLGVGFDRLPARFSLWLWDARQQFGWPILAVAVVGAARLWSSARPWAYLVIVAYAISTMFAVTYNVGDPHVFFLPGHFLVAFAAATAVAPWRPMTGRPTRSAEDRGAGLHAPPSGPLKQGTTALWQLLPIVLIAYAGWRAWDTWPRADRHADRRADLLVARLTTGVNDTNAVLVSDLDWESENALLYSGRHERHDLAWTRLADVMPHFPFFVRDNHAISRDVVVTTDAAARIIAAYGTHFPIVEDELPAALPLSETVARIARGTPYVLSLVGADRRLDAADFDRALAVLAGRPEGRPPPEGSGEGSGEGAVTRSEDPYQVWLGVAGEAPVLHRRSRRPFRETLSLLGDTFTVQMDAWVPFDTFRRGGFGHVMRGRERVMFVERGVSLVWFDADAAPRVVYAAGLYASRPRFRIPAAAPQQLAGIHDAILGRAAP